MPRARDPHPVHIRPATPDDVATLFPLTQGLTDVEQQLNTGAMTEALTGAEWIPQPEPDFCCLVAEDIGKELVGMASYYVIQLTLRARPTLYVNGIFVVPTRRLEGIGTLLMRAVADDARRRGCSSIVWQIAHNDSTGEHFSHCLGARPRVAAPGDGASRRPIWWVYPLAFVA